MKNPVLILFLLGFGLSGNAQLYSDELSFFEKDENLNKTRLYTVIGGEAAILTGTFIGLDRLWYADHPRTSFHYFDDGKNWLAMDKVGHVMTSYYVGYAGQGLLEWSGVEERKARWYGGSLGLVFLTGVEVLDGFSGEWGFSWSDMLANTAGTALLVGQELAWKEQRIVMKYSFHQTGYAKENPALLGKHWYENMLKDYNGQTYWLSFNVHDLSGWKAWPQWLNLAAGYGADGMISAKYDPTIYENKSDFKWQRQYYLSLDLDLRKIPVKSKFLKTLFHAINFIKFPMPALEFNEKEKPHFYPLYF